MIVRFKEGRMDRLSNDALKRFLQGCQIPADPGGASVGAMRRVITRIQLPEQRLDLFFSKRLIGPHGPVAGHHHAALIQSVF